MGITNIGDALPEERREQYLSKPLTNEEQEEQKAAREEELDEARQLHNERTGGHPVEVGQTDLARQESNERVAFDS